MLRTTQSTVEPITLAPLAKGALIYVRVSTDEQAKQGYSLDSQEEACRRLATERGIGVLGVYRDEGESATTAARPRFRELLARCEEDDGIGYVIVLNTDRFARNVADHMRCKALLQLRNIQLLSVQQAVLDDSPEGGLMDTILAGINEFYSRNLGRTVAKNTAKKVSEGGWPRRAPLGYQNVRDPDTKKARLEVDPRTVPVVREVFARYARGGLSAKDISRFLFERGITSRTGRPLAVDYVTRLLRNPAYLGKIPWKGGAVPGVHEALIDAETFLACERVLQEHNRGADRARKHSFLLANLVECETCKTQLSGEVHRKHSGRTFSYYRCIGERNGAGGCVRRFVPAETLEDRVRQWVASAVTGTRFFKLLRVTIESLRQDDSTVRRKQVKGLQNKRTAVEQKLHRLENAILDGTISRDRAKVLSAECLAELERLARELENAKSPDFIVTDDDVEALVSFLGGLGHILTSRTVSEQRRLLRGLVTRFRTREGVIVGVDYTPAFDALVACDAVRIRELWWTIRDLVRTQMPPQAG
jgi:DNA invertase Pin-like site-specific DNA recombinase